MAHRGGGPHTNKPGGSLPGQVTTQSAEEQAIALQRETRDKLIALQQPFLEFGQGQIDPLQQLLQNQQDPESLRRLQLLGTTQGQADFIQNNPFFQQLTGQAQSSLFANQAARGKVGSGGTAAELQSRFVGIGQDLLAQERQGLSQTANLTSGISQRQIGNLFKGVGLGQSAASLQGSGIAGTNENITNLITSAADARSAAGIASSNRRSSNLQSLATIAALAKFSDRRVKKNIVPLDDWMAPSGQVYPTYQYEYIWSQNTFIGVMAQDVEKVNPMAVFEIDGVKVVNYGAL